MFLEYTPLVEACKAKTLRDGEKFFYVFFLGTLEDERGRGLASALVRHHQDIARQAGLPIWLEATTEESVRLYLKLGFVVVGDFMLGVGKAGKDGIRKAGGEGLKIWGMVWRPTVRIVLSSTFTAIQPVLN